MCPPISIRAPTAFLARRDVIRMAAATSLILSGSELLAASSFAAAPTVHHLAQLTGNEYHDPQLGVAIADALLAALATGRLQSATADQLADKLNNEIRLASRDAHFVVMAGDMTGMRNVPPTEPHTETAPLNEAELRFLRVENFGIAEGKVLAGNIGLIAIRPQFYRPAPEVRQRLAQVMTGLSTSDGLIGRPDRNHWWRSQKRGPFPELFLRPTAVRGESIQVAQPACRGVLDHGRARWSQVWRGATRCYLGGRLQLFRGGRVCL